MFTGIITAIGTITGHSKTPAGRLIEVRSTWESPDFVLGESIAMDGACMTVVRADGPLFAVEVSPESLDKTTLGERREGDLVNLERAMAVGDRFGGHFVSGHVDNTGTLLSIDEVGSCLRMAFALPEELRRYVIPKGRITVDGISLTVNDLDQDSGRFDKTTLGERSEGDRVNLEVDMLGKYVERLLAARLEDPTES